MQLTWGFNKIKISKLFVYFFNNLFLQISKCSDVQVLKILTVWTVKNSQTSAKFKNECKHLRYYFPNDIKNSTNSNEKTLRLKQ